MPSRAPGIPGIPAGLSEAETRLLSAMKERLEMLFGERGGGDSVLRRLQAIEEAEDSGAVILTGMMLEYPMSGLPENGEYLECDGANWAEATYPALADFLVKKSVVTFTNGTDRVNWANHKRKDGDVFRFTTTGVAPVDLATGVTYFIINSTTNDFQISATEGGAAINFTSDGTGVHTGIHAPWGYNEGAGTFQTPDSRRRASVGRGGAASTTLGARVGATGGAETHALATAELAAHAHAVTDPTHVHVSVTDMQGGGGSLQGPGPVPYGTRNVPAAATGISIQNTGSGTAHNNLGPRLVVTKMIKI